MIDDEKKIRKELENVNNTVNLIIENFKKGRNSVDTGKLCFNLEMRARKLVSDAEILCEYSLRDIFNSSEIGLTVSIRRNHLKIICPCLLPYRGANAVSAVRTVKLAYLRAVEDALSENTDNYEKMKKCGFYSSKKRKKVVIQYTHIFDREAKVKDADNIDTKFMTDIIAPFICDDDSLKNLTLVSMGRVEEKSSPHTEIDVYIGSRVKICKI